MRPLAPALLGLLLAACSVAGGPGSRQPPTAANALQVVTTTTVFADLVRNVGKDRVTVSSIIPAGVGPEDYEPRPTDAKRVADAQVIISNGAGLDDFLAKLVGPNARADATRIVLGDGIEPIDVDGEPNPHFWLDPTLIIDHYLPSIVNGLSRADPVDAAAFAQAAEAYARELRSLDAELKAEVETLPAAQRKLVTMHDAFPYFARHFGFELIGVILSNVGQEPTGGALADLVAKVRAAHVRAVFSEAQFSPELARTLATEAGVKEVVTTLYNDALGPPPADSYIGMMRWNMDHIVEALR
ncbi:MAG: metal ABC transporter substrate-binding protein [Chloroflexota bacterium]